jgi:hypothetical protein
MTDGTEISLETGRFRARDIEYVTGSYDSVQKRIPEFELAPFRLSDVLPANPYLQAVVRKPLFPAEQSMPVGVVSNSYSLVQHREAAELCIAALRESKLNIDSLKCELGLTPLGEYMVFRVYLPDEHGFTAKDKHPTALRVELINSVDGSHRLVVFFSWLRLICLNGMMIRATKTEVRELHNQALDLSKVSDGIRAGLALAAEDIKKLQEWENTNLNLDKFRLWVDGELTAAWGKKAASRVFHIAIEGFDTKLTNPFEGGPASKMQVEPVEPVPGANAPAKNFYSLLQALTWVSTRRNNVEERLEWQGQIPVLMKGLREKARSGRRWVANR